MNWQLIETGPKNEWVLAWAAGWEMPAVLRLLYRWDDGSGDNDQDYHPTHWAKIVLPE